MDKCTVEMDRDEGGKEKEEGRKENGKEGGGR